MKDKTEDRARDKAKNKAEGRAEDKAKYKAQDGARAKAKDKAEDGAEGRAKEKAKAGVRNLSTHKLPIHVHLYTWINASGLEPRVDKNLVRCSYIGLHVGSFFPAACEGRKERNSVLGLLTCCDNNALSAYYRLRPYSMTALQ